MVRPLRCLGGEDRMEGEHVCWECELRECREGQRGVSQATVAVARWVPG